MENRLLLFIFIYFAIMIIFNAIYLSDNSNISSNQISYSTNTFPLTFLYNIFVAIANGLMFIFNIFTFSFILPSPFNFIFSFLNIGLIFIAISPLITKLISAIGNWVPLT